MKRAIPVWENTLCRADEYARFFDRFETAGGEVRLAVSVDGDYECYVNGRLAAFGQYSDFPYDKTYDSVDITPYCAMGENTVCFLVWYIGKGSMRYAKGTPFLLYEVSEGDRVLAFSGERTLSDLAPDYVQGACRVITGQLGLSYTYDGRGDDGYRRRAEIPAGLHSAAPVAVGAEGFSARPIEKLACEPFAPAVLVDPERRVYDLGRETAGYLSVSFEAGRGEPICVFFGEHLDADGNVPARMGGRDFCIRLIGGGEREFTGYMRRLGCRYLQVSGNCRVKRIGLVPVQYPVTERVHRFASALHQRIYDTAVRTLRLCMFEHYEDTPWREQCLYVMDSRNQMLCGYEAFGEYRFARACLALFGKDRREDGLLNICVPSREDLVIPFFSLMYPVTVEEYCRHAGDLSLAREYYEKMRGILRVFSDRMENGIVPSFADDKRYWNFYEWNDTLCGNCCKTQAPATDLMLNAAFSMALKSLSSLAHSLGYGEDAARYSSMARDLNARIREVFYDDTAGAYRTATVGSFVPVMSVGTQTSAFAVLPNAFAILCGACTGGQARAVCEKIASDALAYPATLSMLAFVYDALLLTDEDKYRDYVLSEIGRIWGSMLDRGATSFWETIKGAEDFYGAGSLCHGWSAIPILYLSRYASRYDG